MMLIPRPRAFWFESGDSWGLFGSTEIADLDLGDGGAACNV